MTKYLISFPGEAMVFRKADLESVAEAALPTSTRPRPGAVCVFGSGIDEDVDPVLVAGHGTVTEGTYAGQRCLAAGTPFLRGPSRPLRFQVR